MPATSMGPSIKATCCEVHADDLIVPDRRLPDGDGLWALSCAFQEREHEHQPFPTAVDHGKALVEGLEAGADDYVGKPFDLEVLEARVGRARGADEQHDRRPRGEDPEAHGDWLTTDAQS